jgi:hypothetical protein
MKTDDRSFEATCRQLYANFFDRYPNDKLQGLANQALAALLMQKIAFPGQAAGWAAGIIYTAAGGVCGNCGALNADFERAFGTTMSTVRKRAAQVEHLLEAAGAHPAGHIACGEDWTLRDEANTICAYAFRNGPIEDIHADGRITDPEMKELMSNASEHLAKLMTMKRDSPEEYERFIRDYHRKFCLRWER